MRNAEAFTAMLLALPILTPIKNRHNFATDTLKRATIEMLRKVSDADSIFLGSLLSDISKSITPGTANMALRLEQAGLVLEANPHWLCFLAELGLDYVVYELKRVLTSVILSHPVLLREYPPLNDEGSGLIPRVAMELCVTRCMSGGVYSNFAPVCPKCYYAAGDKKDQAKRYPEKYAAQDCPVCLGTGQMALNTDVINAIISAHSAGNTFTRFRVPYDFDMHKHRILLAPLEEALPPACLRAEASPSLQDWVSDELVVNNSFDKAIIDSTVTHAIAQSRGFLKGSGNGRLMDIFTKLRRKKKVPYLLRLRGTLGASMQALTVATRYRPNRRFGYLYPGAKSVPKQRYVLALDTSGSIPLDEVKKILNEFLSLRNYSEQVECRVIFFHHDIYYDKDMNEYTNADLSRLETGGTDFDKVFHRVFSDKKERERGPAVLVMYTDGYCSISFNRKDVKGKIVWLLTPDGDSNYIKRWDKRPEIIKIEKKTEI